MLENGDAKKKAQVTNHLGFILAETDVYDATRMAWRDGLRASRPTYSLRIL